MHLVGGSLAAKIQGLEELPWRSNYFAGPAETWRTGVPNYRRVRCSGVYPGIDLEYHWEGGQLEYDWIIHPGSDPARIRVAFGGVSGLSLSANRSLRLRTALGSLEHQSPRAYQIVEGQRHEVSAQFLISRHGVSFRLGSYDRSLPLVIDPTIVFAALLGASTPPSSQSPTLSAISAVAVDPGGNIYAFAGSAGSDFPKTGAFAPNAPPTGLGNTYVLKLDPTGTKLLFSTYIGGILSGNGIAADASGVYITGSAVAGFPTTPGAFQTTAEGVDDAFIAKLTPDGGTLVYSTLLGGSDIDNGIRIAVDATGDAYVLGATASTDFPTTPGTLPYQCGGSSDSDFIAKVNPRGSGLVYSTCIQPLFGIGGIAVNSGGNVFVAGSTNSASFPTTPGAFQPRFAGGTCSTGPCANGVAFKLNASASSFIYATYLGGPGSSGPNAIAIDNAGNAYLVGNTLAGNFLTENALQPNFGGGGSDGFVSKLSSTGSSLIYSTYLGGSGDDRATGVAVDSQGDAYVTGYTQSKDFPLVAPLTPPFKTALRRSACLAEAPL